MTITSYVTLGVAFIVTIGIVILVLHVLHLLGIIRQEVTHTRINMSGTAEDHTIMIKVLQDGRVVYKGAYESAPPYIQQMYVGKIKEMEDQLKELDAQEL